MLKKNLSLSKKHSKQNQSMSAKNRVKDYLPKHAFFTIVLTILIPTSFLACSWKRINTNPEGGVIYVGQPQVLSREAIVPERQAEAEWLRKQLANTPETASFQGISDYLVTQAFSAKLAASFDPLGGKVRDQLTKLEVDKLEAERDRLKLQQEIEEIKLRNLLKEVQDEGTVADDPQIQPVAIDQSKIDSINQKIDELEKKIKTLEEASVKPENESSTLDSLANARARRSTVSLTPFELLKDQTAFRSQVNAARREKLLDETHDLMGRSLYEMKFSVAMVPPKDQGLFAYVEIKVEDDQSYKLYKSPKSSEISKPNKDPIPPITQKSLNEELLDGFFYRRLAWALANRVYREYSMLLSEIQYEPPVPDTDYIRYVNSRSWTTESEKEKIYKYLLFKYKYLCHFLKMKFDSKKGNLNLSVEPNFEHSGDENFNKALNRIAKEKIDQEKVINIEPKEYAQNISKVSTRQNMMELMASLSAIFQGGIEAGGSVGYSKETRELLEANQRQPLAIGFNNEDSTFGWILGPKFENYKGKPYFSNVPLNYPLNATFVVPAWAESISLTVDSGWIDKNGKKVKSGEQITIDVPLSPSIEGLIDAFMNILRGPNRRPRIFIPKDGFNLIQGDENQNLLIRGYNLWRNPEVYMNNIRADKVSILPNMEGIYAHFTSKILIDSNLGDLTVVTNTGMKNIPQIVHIVPKKSQSISPFVTLSSPRMLWVDRQKALSNIVLSIDQLMKPHLLPQFEAFSFKEGFAANRKGAGIVSSGASELKLSVPKEVAGDLKNIDVVEIDVRVRRDSGDLFGSSVVSGKKTFVVFTKESDMQLAITSEHGTTQNQLELKFKEGDDSKSIILKVPITNKMLFYRAYPGFSNVKEIILETSNSILNISTLKSSSMDFTKGIFYIRIPKEVFGIKKSIVLNNLYVTYGLSGKIIPVSGNLKLLKEERNN
jgi:hypothetical protein